MSVRTRFAPSPTGFMHIGGMRTALFNWLWARHTGGTFVLRIDDTDRERNVEAALTPILDAFCWLGLDWDEGPEVGGEFGPYFQSQRCDLYSTACEKLLVEGKAFRDFDPPEVTRADREAAEKEKRSYLNVRRSLDLSEADVQAKLAADEPFVVRFLMPRGEEQTLKITDSILGDVQWNVSDMPDPVIARADGSPLYNFATVIDDARMRITHVIRAQEHLSNTPVQAMIHHALGHELPTFAHIPYVAAPGSKEKLSKREKSLAKYRKNPQFKELFERGDRVLPRIGLELDATRNPVMVAYYKEMGFLPRALLNALSRLGWSFDDKTEFMPLDFVVENFTLDRVIKSPAGFDADKLLSFQQHWIGELPLEEKIEGCLPFLERAGLANGDDSREFVGRVIEALGDRLKLFSDILDYDEFFVPDETLAYDEQAFEKRIRKPPEAVELLTGFRDRLEQAESFTAAALDPLMHEFAEERGVKLGQVIHAIRIAVTGKPTGPGMFDSLELLGQRRCVKRIDLALSRV